MMMRKITAVYDSKADAQQAQARLVEVGVPAGIGAVER